MELCRHGQQSRQGALRPAARQMGAQGSSYGTLCAALVTGMALHHFLPDSDTTIGLLLLERCQATGQIKNSPAYRLIAYFHASLDMWE